MGFSAPDGQGELASRVLRRDRSCAFFEEEDFFDLHDVDDEARARHWSALTRATAILFANLTDVREVRLPASWVRSPVFWVGRTKESHLAGVLSFRVDT